MEQTLTGVGEWGWMEQTLTGFGEWGWMEQTMTGVGEWGWMEQTLTGVGEWGWMEQTLTGFGEWGWMEQTMTGWVGGVDGANFDRVGEWGWVEQTMTGWVGGVDGANYDGVGGWGWMEQTLTGVAEAIDGFRSEVGGGNLSQPEVLNKVKELMVQQRVNLTSMTQTIISQNGTIDHQARIMNENEKQHNEKLMEEYKARTALERQFIVLVKSLKTIAENPDLVIKVDEILEEFDKIVANKV
ncbi:hypothetical protein Btru_064924 [Bulinus truncatus]|nr:hypothetical protein Btru_064924 [Bulinus truncatus]